MTSSWTPFYPPLYSLSLQEISHEGHVVLAVPLSALGQLAHHSGVARGRGEQQQAAVVLGMVEALLGQAKLALTDGQLCQLLPLLLRLPPEKTTGLMLNIYVHVIYCQLDGYRTELNPHVKLKQ